MRNKKTMAKVLALLLAVLALTLSLAACGGGNSKALNLQEGDTDATTYFSRILPLVAAQKDGYAPREIFVAASRGYNMTAADFDDSKVELGVVGEVDLDAAKAALDMVKPSDTASVMKFEEWRNALTAEQVMEIVGRMQAEVDLAKPSFPGIILVWIGKFLSLFGNYVLALFVFAIIIEVLLLYFGIRQQKNSLKQAALSPKERAIRKKYAGRNDQVSMRKMQEEIQQLYQEEGFNPMSGCLPLLIQMPIIIALYNIVIDPLRYVLGMPAGLSTALSTYATTSRAAGGLGMALQNAGKGTIELLSKLTADNLSGLKDFAYFKNSAACAEMLDGIVGKIPNFNLFGLNMGLTPSFSPIDKINLWLLAIPVLTFVAYFFSMKLTRKFSYQSAVQDPQMGCSNNVMDVTMPLMSVYITFITPAAVGIYWIFKCIIGVVKQFIIHKLMPMPVFTEEDYKRAEREMKAKSKGKRETVYVTAADGAKYRSLHHIDDDDELPPKGAPVAPQPAPEKSVSQPKKDAPQEDADRPVLKEDRKNDKK